MATKYRALTDLALRARPDPTCEEWLHWRTGEVFEPPPHMDMVRCLERGIVEEIAPPRTRVEREVAEIMEVSDG